MADGDPQIGDGMRDRRRRAIETGCQVVTLLVGTLYVLAFAVALQTGYLSWIGVATGILLTVPGVVAPILGLAGRRRLSAALTTAGIGLPIMVALIMQVSLLRAKSDSAGNWRPYRFDAELAALEARRAVPNADNAAHRYESLFAVMNVNDEPEFLFLGGALREEFGKQPWKGEDSPQVSAWLDSQSGVINELLAIGGIEQCRWPIQADRYDEHSVPYKELRRSVSLLAASGNRDLGEGRLGEALAKYFCMIRIAEHLRQQPSTLDRVIGFRVEGTALTMMRYALIEGNPSGEDIAQIARRLPSAADPWPEEWRSLLECEKLRYMNSMGRLYEVDDAGTVRLAGKIVISPRDEQERRNPVWVPSVYWLMSMPRDPHGVRGMADRHFAGIARRVDSAGPSEMDYERRTPDLSVGGMLKFICNFFRSAIETWFFDEGEYLYHRRWSAGPITERRGTWLVLGLRCYRDAHGVWPGTLEAVSQYVPAETLLDPLAGTAFVYTSDGDSFKLYSKGPNRLDEGGRHGYIRALKKLEDDLTLWPPPADEPDTEPVDDEELKKQYAEIYGKDYAEAMFRNDPNDKR